MNKLNKIMMIIMSSCATFLAPNSVPLHVPSFLAQDTLVMPGDTLPEKGFTLFDITEFCTPRSYFTQILLVNNPNNDDLPYKLIYIQEDGTPGDIFYCCEDQLCQLYKTGIIFNRYTTVSPELINPKKHILPYLCKGSHVVACEIKGGYFLITTAEATQSAILSTAEFDALKNFQGVQGFKLDRNRRLIDVDVLDQDGNPLFQLKTAPQVPMSQLFLDIGFMARFSGYKDPYNTYEINGIKYTGAGWDTFARGTEKFNFAPGDSIKIYNQAREANRHAKVVFCGKQYEIDIPEQFSTAGVLSYTLGFIDLNRFSIYVDGKRVLSCHSDQTSERIVTLPQGEDILITAEICKPIYEIDYKTGSVKTFYLKYNEGQCGIYKDNGSEDIFVDSVKTENYYDSIIQGKYLSDDNATKTTRTQIGTMNGKPVYLLDFSEMNMDRIIQTAARFLELTPDEFDALRQGNKVCKTNAGYTEEIRLDAF